MTRFFELTGTDGGDLPPHPQLKVGAIIAVKRANSPLPGAQWNAEAKCWVTPIWTECADPRVGAA